MKRILSLILISVLLVGCGASTTPEIHEGSENKNVSEANESIPDDGSEEIPVEEPSKSPKRDLSKITGPFCALTFDDGPSDTTAQILDVLEKYGCTASFFVVGAWASDEGDLEIMKRAVEMGCTIENHTWSHKNLTQMTDEEVIEAYTSVQDFVYEAVGDYPRFLRAPGLSLDGRVMKLIPLTFINGSGGSADWNSNPEDSATSDLETRVQGILNVAKDGHIYLLHDCSGNNLTPEALDIALPKLIEQGYTFVNLRELFEIKGQKLTPGGKTYVHGYTQVWTDVK